MLEEDNLHFEPAALAALTSFVGAEPAAPASQSTSYMDRAHLRMDCWAAAFAGEHCSLAVAHSEAGAQSCVADVVDIPYI